MATVVGSLVANLGFNVDDDGAQRFERRLRTVREDASKRVEVPLGADVDQRSFDRYQRNLDEIRAKVRRRDEFKAKLGADFDARAFNAYERDLARARRESERTTKSIEHDTDRQVRAQGRLRTAFGSVYGQGGALFAAAGGLYALKTAGQAAIESSSDIAESITKNRQLFGDYAVAVERFAERSADSLGIAKASTLEYAGVFGNLSRAIGISEKDSSKLSVRLVKLAADLASFNNTSIDEALQALQSGLVGESEPLRRFGVTISANAVAAEAMRSGLVKVKKETFEYRVASLAVEKAQLAQNKAIREHGQDSFEAREATLALEKANKELTKTAAGGKVELTAQQKALATTELIFRQTAQAQGDFKRTSEGNANQLRILKARFSDLIAELGDRLLPLVNKGVRELNDFVTEVKNNTGRGREFRDVMRDIGDRLTDVYEAGKDVIGFLKDHTSLVKSAAGAWVAYKLAVKLAGAAAVVSGLVGRGRGVVAPAAAAVTAGGARGAAGGVAAGAAAGLSRAVPIAAIAAAIGIALSDLKNRNESRTGSLDEARATIGDAEERLKRQGRLREVEDLRALQAEILRTSKGGDDLIESFERLARSAEKMSKTTSKEFREVTANIRGRWREIRRDTNTTWGDIRDQIASSTRSIKTRLGKDSAEGKEALAANFRGARRAIREAMKAGTIDVDDGLAKIKQLMRRELKAYGLSGSQANAYLRSDSGDYRGSDNPSPGGGHARGGRVRRAGGGWIGARGMVSDDIVPIAPGALAAYGEYDAHGPGGRRAILNQHQAPIAEIALAAGGYPGLDQLPRGGQLPILERALEPLGGLDRLFAAITRPHNFARGGIVPVPGFPGERANQSILDEIAWVSRRFGLTLTDAFGPGHKSPGHTVTGTAADFAGPDRSMDAAVKALVARGYLVGYDGRFGSKAWPGHGPTSVAGGNAHLHVEFGGAGTVGSVVSKIARVATRMSGALGGVAQGALDTARRGANRRLKDVVAASLSVPTGGGRGAGAGSAQVRRWIAAGLRLAGQPATPANINTLFGRVMQESGGDPEAINRWDINAQRGDPSIGLLQTIGATFNAYKVKGHGNIRNPIHNVAAAVRYMLAEYGHLVGAGPGGYASGGRVSAKDQAAKQKARARAQQLEAEARAKRTRSRAIGAPAVGLPGAVPAGPGVSGLTAPGDEPSFNYAAWEALQENIAMRVRAGVLSEEEGNATLRSVGQGLLSGGSFLKQVERWDIMGDLREMTTQGTSSALADAEAIAAQASERARIAEAKFDVSERSLRVLGNPLNLDPSRIGLAKTPPQVVINTLHPADPATLSAIARASNAGNSYGPTVQSPREVLGA